jgi:hypothetical protein
LTTTATERRVRQPATESGIRRTGWPSQLHPLLLVALTGIFVAQARTLSFYFFQDDYVPFGEIVTEGPRTYVWNLVRADDLTPNWRVIPGLLYLANYELFGMNPLPMHALMLALHLGTAALLYRIVWRATANMWAAVVAAVVFGLHPTYAGTLGQVASVPHIASAFFLAATVNAAFECAREERAWRSNAWSAAMVVAFLFAVMANESMSVMFPAFALGLLLWDHDRGMRRRIVRASVKTLPLAAIALATAGAVAVCDCTEADSVYAIEHAHRVMLIFSGRLLYPIGLEPPTFIDAPHLWAGMGLLAASAALFVFGGAIGRVGVVWVVLALVPHIFISTHTANRFTYLATPGFALAVAGAVEVVWPYARRAGPALVGAALVAGAPWYAWQTHLQNEPWRETTENWELLHDEAERVFPAVPPGSRVEIIGGPLVHPIDNFFVMPALGYTIWGPDVTLQTFAADDPYVERLLASENPFIAEFQGDELEPLR